MNGLVPSYIRLPCGLYETSIRGVCLICRQRKLSATKRMQDTCIMQYMTD